MSTPSQEPEKCITVEQVVDEWVYHATIKRLQLHIQAMEPLSNTRRDEAFLEMSHLLQEAIEEVRMVGAALREKSQELRAHGSKLRDHSTALRQRSTPSMEEAGCTKESVPVRRTGSG